MTEYKTERVPNSVCPSASELPNGFAAEVTLVLRESVNCSHVSRLMTVVMNMTGLWQGDSVTPRFAKKVGFHDKEVLTVPWVQVLRYYGVLIKLIR